MNIMDTFLKKLDGFPDLLDGKDLINLGLYKHRNIAYRARKNGYCPSFIRLPGRILYPKDAVREFVLKRFQDCSLPMQTKSSSVTDK